jgi:HEAT repeat protein
MSNERDHDATPDLHSHAVQLGERDWRTVMDAARVLAGAGRAGIDAVLRGLSHPNARVRRGCAGYMDHHATDACIPQLRWTALHDPAAKVRRVAVHSASCQECKPEALTGDLVGLLIEVALEDPNKRVREKAIGGLGSHPPNSRSVAALKQILRPETNARLRYRAHRVLRSQDPAYRARVDAEARERGIKAGRTRSSPREADT